MRTRKILILVFLSLIATQLWLGLSKIPYSQAAIIRESIDIESPHPVPSYYEYYWNITRPNAVKMRVHFSYISVEYNVDYIDVGNYSTIVNTFTGYYSNIWSDWVGGNQLLIDLIAGYKAYAFDGFFVDMLEVEEYTAAENYSLSFKFMENSGTQDFTNEISWAIVQTPTGELLNLTSPYTLPQSASGEWTLRKIVYRRNNVVPSINPTHILTSDYEWKINTRIYSVDFTDVFQDEYGNPLRPMFSNFTLIWPFGGQTSPLTLTVYYLQNGTWGLKNVFWEGSDVSPTTMATFNPIYGNPSIICRVYEADFTDVFEDQDGNPVTPNGFKLICPNGTTTRELRIGSYLLQAGTYQITNIIWNDELITPSPSPRFDPSTSFPITVKLSQKPALPITLILGGIGGLGAIVAIAVVVTRRKPKIVVPPPLDVERRLSICKNALVKLEDLHKQRKVSERVYRELKAEYEAEVAALEAKIIDRKRK